MIVLNCDVCNGKEFAVDIRAGWPNCIQFDNLHLCSECTKKVRVFVESMCALNRVDQPKAG